LSLFDIPLYLSWPAITVCATCPIYKQYIGKTVLVYRYQSTVWGYCFWGYWRGRGFRALALWTACGQFLHPGSYADSFARRL